ncbi:MAG TPA: SDR family NAD(P)-dependent oxidoreductase [Kribbella sp.]|uniref:SDR family NAD(P)-dependent oxidoreductase n=1 Tax=Kribbella sp. TaxID=1871183 RepID=UPI002D77C35A|nr:SDR family NAD(P)-dependent oxidoreductase [Kribbella sp.]HET6299098.1 SDR family NAD(P)-dependent oxidoreductase [Kribbella sp.]
MKVFLITGSSRGLGRAIAEAVLEAGHQLVATARKPEQLDDLVAKYGDQIRAVRLDVTDYAAAQSAVQAAVDAFGRLDVVVNNAGYANVASVEDMEIEDFRQQIDTNLLGVVNVTKAALPQLREQGSGYIIQVSSVGGRAVAAGLSAYQAAKWAVGGFSGVLAREVNPLGIKVTVLEPGGMNTDWAGSSMTVHPVSAPYEQSLGLMRDMRASGVAANDPAKVAQVVLQLVDSEEVPERLLIGPDALAVANQYERARDVEKEKWLDVTISTVHDNVDARFLDPTDRL